MKLQTRIPLQKANHQIGYSSKMLLLGSCFVENIGEKLNYFKFQNIQNPFGIVFHPLAIERLVTTSLTEERYTEKDVFCLHERWHCFDAHSDLSEVSKENLLQRLKERQKATRKSILNTTHVVITLGTAWVYQHKETSKKVANCHKVPQKEFDKQLLEIPEIEESLIRTVRNIRKVNKTAQIIFTVSPVRHLKDGFIENQQSKAHLIAAVHKVKNLENVFYFPSYEIMMDELRDYRFYKRDMIHPNDIAVDYIWEKFKEVWVSEKAYPIMEKVNVIQKGLGHKAFEVNSQEHKKFVKSLKEKMKNLQNNFPCINFNDVTS